jgi:hypothetical protein
MISEKLFPKYLPLSEILEQIFRYSICSLISPKYYSDSIIIEGKRRKRWFCHPNLNESIEEIKFYKHLRISCIIQEEIHQ